MAYIIQQNINIKKDIDALEEILDEIIDSFKKIVSIRHYII